jgi:hypothetical protein
MEAGMEVVEGSWLAVVGMMMVVCSCGGCG